jgi:hypothetical protein
MPDQFLDVPDRQDLRQVHGTLLIGRRMDGTLIPVLVDADGILLLASGPGNDYSGMAESYLLVPDQSALKQVHGSLLVGKDGATLLPVAVDDNGRIIATGGDGGGGGGFMLRDAPTDRPNFPDNEPPPADLRIDWLCSFRDGTPDMIWDHTANAGAGGWILPS